MIKLIPISRDEFLNNNLLILCHDPVYSKSYYKISLNDKDEFSFSTQSEINPKLFQINDILV